MHPLAWNDARRARLLELFGEAMDLEPGEQAAFCARSCGDDAELRARLEAMLRADTADGGPIAAAPMLSPAKTAELAAAHDELTARPAAGIPDPEWIGSYRIRERLGDGGMGVVYLAEQHEPVRREVALKVIKPGMDSARVIARFEAERQTLARMNHPGIARIHDGGATPEGRPYFVMEHIRGERLQDYCRNRELPLDERLELFSELCDAVQHAHQKGVIHRDLKPSNVLVTERDGRPQPVVIDFGIARAMGESVDDHTRLTFQHEMVGTPEYMAPEQAAPGPLNQPGEATVADIDSRADIYSLGVLLFELLTGELPFDRDTPASQRTPCPPSTRARHRREHEHPAFPRSTLRGELDWITLKALEPDRERRYPSASELAADLRRYLAHEPVSAGPPSAWYRVRTFVRRHRLRVAAATVVLLAILGGSAAALWGLLEARAQRDEARALLAGSERMAELFAGLLSQINREHGPLDKRAVLDTAAQQLDKIALSGRLPRAESNLHRVMGELYASIGENALAFQQLRRSLDLLDQLPADQAPSPLELHRALARFYWIAVHAPDAELNTAVYLRSIYSGVEVFVDELPELARRLHSFIQSRTPQLPEQCERVMHHAEQHLPDGDPRWEVVGNVLVIRCLAQWWQLAAVGPENPLSAWFPPFRKIYCEKAGLPRTNERVLCAEVGYLTQLALAERYTEALELAREAAPPLNALLRDGDRSHEHNLLAWLAWSEAIGHCGLGDFERGLPRFRTAFSILERLGDRSYMTCFTWMAYVEALTTSGLEDGTRLRDAREGLCRAVGSKAVSISLRTLTAALGPEHETILGEMRAVREECERTRGYVPALAEKFRGWREKVPEATPQAAMVGAWLIFVVQQWPLASTPAEDVMLLEYASGACQQANPNMRSHAKNLLANAQLEAGENNAALATASSLIDQFERTGNAADISCQATARFQRGAALGRLGRPGAEIDLLRGHQQLLDSLGPTDLQTTRAHYFLQEFYRDQGRDQDGVELAQQRLRRLLRDPAPPFRIHLEIYTITHYEACTGPAADVAVQAARKVCELEPGIVRSHVDLGAALLRAGELDEALEELAEADRLAADTAEGGVSLPAFRAIALARSARMDEARQALREARERLAEMSPPWPELQALVAEAEAAVGTR